MSGGNGACPERPWLLQLVREEASGNKVGESGKKCSPCIFKQECCGLKKSAFADDFSLRSDYVRPFPFLPSSIVPTRLSVDDAGKRMEELRCGLAGNFSIAPSEHAPAVLAPPPLKESCNPVVSRTERARSPSLSAPCIKTGREARFAAEVCEAVEAERARKWMIGRSIGCTPALKVFRFRI